MAIAIYVRQSVEKENSISCETQVEHCKEKLNPSERKEKIIIFKDEGFTGANTNRDAFQKMMRMVEQDRISKIVVYKLDRISRSIIDYSKMLKIFKKHSVSFACAEDNIDTSNPMGEAMSKIVMIFAEMERDNTILRVTQAYEHRSAKQFYMGGRRPYGFDLQETVIDNIKTKMLIIKPDEAEQVKYIFENYAVEGVSLRRLMDNLNANNIKPIDGTWSTAKLSAIIQNPIYVQADNLVYDYYNKNNANIVSEPMAFDGIHGAQLYGKTKHKTEDMSDMKLVVMRHEGFVPSDVWLSCQKKIMKNKQIGNALSNKTSWLGGKIFCKSCGRTMTVTKGAVKSDGTQTRYFSCTGKSHNRACKGVKKPLYADSLEDMVYELIAEKLAVLKQHRKKITTDNTLKINDLKNQLSEIKRQQNKIMDMLLSDTANEETMEIANERAALLGKKHRNIVEQIVTLEEADKELVNVVVFSKQWKKATFKEQKNVCNVLIDKIYIHEDGTAEVVWNI